MRIRVNDKEVEIPIDSRGNVNSDTLRRMAGIPVNRALVVMSPDGSNRLINPGESVPVNPAQQYWDAPTTTRG